MTMAVRAKAIVSEKKRMAMTVMAQIDMKAPSEVAWEKCNTKVSVDGGEKWKGKEIGERDGENRDSK